MIIPITHDMNIIVNAMYGQLQNEMSRRLELEEYDANHAQLMAQIREVARVQS